MVQWETTSGLGGNDSIREENQDNLKRGDSTSPSTKLCPFFVDLQKSLIETLILGD